jgi:hypothetical protein
MVDPQLLIPFYLTIPLGIRFLVNVLEILLKIYFVLFVSHAPLTACDRDKHLVLARENPELCLLASSSTTPYSLLSQQ